MRVWSQVLAVSLVACAAQRAAGPGVGSKAALEFIEDDYPRAVALAREKGVPIFVDAWASW